MKLNICWSYSDEEYEEFEDVLDLRVETYGGRPFLIFTTEEEGEQRRHRVDLEAIDGWTESEPIMPVVGTLKEWLGTVPDPHPRYGS